MRVVVDADACVSSGACAAVAPEVFEIGDDGLLHVHQPEPPEPLRQRVLGAAELCPTGAITVEG